MEVVMGYENNGKHPNSLAQLRPVIDSERAREMQAKGAEKRRENKALRDAMRLSASEFKKIKEEVISEMPSAVDILKVQLVKAMQVEDQETIERLAIALAEYEQPKLQRIDQTNLSLDTSELSEEELQKKIAELSG
jgi:hypothetical protein|tara:strand:+ start:829 stop:1236 length:408 start_codon:yes stop_codon:yes gene_type:complete